MARKSAARKSPGRKSAKGTRAQVSRGSAKATPGGLSLDNGLFRSKDGRLKSVKVSRQAKSRYAKNTGLQDRAKAVKDAFAAVKKVKKAGDKINSPAVLKSPLDAIANPKKYLK